MSKTSQTPRYADVDDELWKHNRVRKGDTVYRVYHDHYRGQVCLEAIEDA